MKQANGLRGAVYFEFAATFIIIVFTLLLLVHFAFKFLALSLAYDLTTELLAVVKQTDLGGSGGSNLTFHINPGTPQNENVQRSCVCSEYSNQEVICKKFCNLVQGQKFISALVHLVSVTITTREIRITTQETNTNPLLTEVEVTGSYQSEFDVFRFLSSSALNNFNVTLRGVL